MSKLTAVCLIHLLVLSTLSCSYHRALVNYDEYDEVSMHPSNWDGEALGMVSANNGGAIWNDCTKAAKASIWILIDETRALGGNAIGDIRWMPGSPARNLTAPSCKRGWGWFLIWPVLATPVFMSTKVEAQAYRIDESEARSAGLYVIPESEHDQANLVEEIVEEITVGGRGR